MAIFILWIAFSAIIGSAGKSRKIGGAGAFFCSLLLSPVIGLFAVLLSKSLVDEQREQKVVEYQRQQAEALQSLKPNKSLAEQLESLAIMHQVGQLTPEEYSQAKAQAISANPA